MSMSAEAGRVGGLLLEEAFGELVGRVGNYLTKHGAKCLPDILKGVDLDTEQVYTRNCQASVPCMYCTCPVLTLAGEEVSLCAHSTSPPHSPDEGTTAYPLPLGHGRSFDTGALSPLDLLG